MEYDQLVSRVEQLAGMVAAQSATISFLPMELPKSDATASKFERTVLALAEEHARKEPCHRNTIALGLVKSYATVL